jgi:hypothetical protein
MHEKIIIYENFIQMKYFDQLKECFDNIVNSIKHDIRQILQNYLLFAAEHEIESAAFFFSSSLLSNYLTSVLKFSSLKKIEIMLSSKRLSLIVSTIENEKFSCRAIVLRHEWVEKLLTNDQKKIVLWKIFQRIVNYFLIKKKRLFSSSKINLSSWDFFSKYTW